MKILILSILMASMHVYAADDANNYSDKPKPPSVKLDEDLDCATKTKLYRESQACFEEYRRVNKSLKKGAFKACKEIQYPTECFE
jgi:hypothetical protein